MFEVTYAEKRDRGQKRPVNQDFVASFSPSDPMDLQRSGRLYILADGVGGASDGEKASQFAAQKVLSEYYRYPNLPPRERLVRLFQQAGNELYQHAEQSANYKRMATTMVAAVILENRLIVANVGDSRAFLIRNGQLTQITRDHNLVGEMVQRGELSEQEAKNSRVKNRLTRSIGGEMNVRVDVFDDITLQSGDRIFLCSDGLTRYALNEQIQEMVSTGEPQEAVDRAIQFANQSGGADNISSTLIQIGGPVGESWAAEDEKETATVPGFEAKTRRGAFTSGPLAYLVVAAGILAVVAIIALAVVWVPSLLSGDDGSGPTATAQAQATSSSLRTLTALAAGLLPTDTLSPEPSETQPEVTVTATFTLSPPAPTDSLHYVCEQGLPSRLDVGDQAAVSSAVRDGLKLYESPQAESPTETVVPIGDLVNIVSGPQCVGNIVWWEIRLPEEGGNSGWVQEGNEEVSWLIPTSTACVFSAGTDDYSSLSAIFPKFSLPYDPNTTYYYYPVEVCVENGDALQCNLSQRALIGDHAQINAGWWILVYGVPQESCESNGGRWSTQPPGE